MKNIGAELKKNIALREAEEAKEKLIEGTHSKKALKLLKQAIINSGYDPSSIRIYNERVVFRKKEVTVRFSLHNRGFTFTNFGIKPDVIVHLGADGRDFVNCVTLKKVISILVDPRYWEGL